MFKGWIALIALALLPSAAMAASPPACAPNEAPVVCNVVVQRNSALDSLALEEAKADQLQTKADGLKSQLDTSEHMLKAVSAKQSATQAYWRKYVSALSKAVRPRGNGPGDARRTVGDTAGTRGVHGQRTAASGERGNRSRNAPAIRHLDRRGNERHPGVDANR
jgi:hypothetical protein